MLSRQAGLPGKQEEVDESLLIRAIVELQQRAVVDFVPVQRCDKVNETQEQVGGG